MDTGLGTRLGTDTEEGLEQGHGTGVGEVNEKGGTTVKNSFNILEPNLE